MSSLGEAMNFWTCLCDLFIARCSNVGTLPGILCGLGQLFVTLGD